MIGVLLALAVIFAQLSLLAFGGGATVLPEMQRQVVQVHHWMSAQEFSALFALAQAAPGPNMMVVTLIGWHVAGWRGALITTLGMFGPSSILTGAVLHAWERFKDRPWRRIVQNGLAPTAAGLIAASAVVITRGSAHGWVLGVIAAVAALILVKTRLHPLAVLAAGALVGLTGFGQV